MVPRVQQGEAGEAEAEMLTSEAERAERAELLICSIVSPLRRGASARPCRDPFPHGHGQRLDARLYLVVRVLAVVAVEVEREASILGEGTQEFGEQLDVEGSYLLWHRAEVAGEMRTSAEVDDGRGERFDERRARVGEAYDVTPLAERLVEGAAQHEPRILDGVVVIHPRIALRLYMEVHAGVVGEQVQKMVQKSNTRSYLGTSFAVELEAHPDERLGRLTLSI